MQRRGLRVDVRSLQLGWLGGALVLAALLPASFGCEELVAPTPTPEVTLTPEATAPAAEPERIDAEPVHVDLELHALPFDLALIIAGGRVERMRRGADGSTVREVLFDLPPDLPGPVMTYWNVHHVGPALPQGYLAVAVCSRGYCGGDERASSDAQLTFYLSRDGGVTWTERHPLDGAFIIASGVSPSRLLLQRLPQGKAEISSEEPIYMAWPARVAVTPPEEHTAKDRGPYALPDGRVAWFSGNRLLDGDGELLLELPAAEGRGLAVLATSEGGRLMVTWEQGNWHWSVYERRGERFAVTRTLEAPFQAIPTAWLSESDLLINGPPAVADEVRHDEEVPGTRLPGVLELGTEGDATVKLFSTGPGMAQKGLGAKWAVAAQVGPFAEVRSAQECVPLHTRADEASVVLTCIPDRVLLTRLADEVADGWLPVRTPTGTDGWVSTHLVTLIGSPGGD